MSRAISILISALGGEGGGVLAAWLSNAAVEAGLPVQRTSVPGVAQRTGATTYYLEVFPTPWWELGGSEPVLGLHPSECGVDIIVATELLEASRALHRGFASRDRTLLITSTHRVYTIAEKTSAVHGRFNERTAYEAIAAMTHTALQFDCQSAARAAGSHINAILLGAIAGSRRLPISDDTFRAAMRREGKSVDENLRGFEAGLRAANADLEPKANAAAGAASVHSTSAPLLRTAQQDFPGNVWPVVREGIARLLDYQGSSYAQLYVKRLLALKHLDAHPFELLESTARQLALWMSYEDVIRVAQLKSNPKRMQRIRLAQGAKPNQPLVVVDYLKPGPAELCSILPPWLGRRLMTAITRRGLEARLSFSLQVHTTSILGFAQMRLLASLRRWRPHSYGFREEQQVIESWLARVRQAALRDRRLGLEVALCANLVRGYSDTRKRGYARLQRIFAAVVDPLLEDTSRADPADAVRRARVAALSDDTGAALEAEVANSHSSRLRVVRSKPQEGRLNVDGR